MRKTFEVVDTRSSIDMRFRTPCPWWSGSQNDNFRYKANDMIQDIAFLPTVQRNEHLHGKPR